MQNVRFRSLTERDTPICPPHYGVPGAMEEAPPMHFPIVHCTVRPRPGRYEVCSKDQAASTSSGDVDGGCGRSRWNSVARGFETLVPV